MRIDKKRDVTLLIIITILTTWQINTIIKISELHNQNAKLEQKTTNIKEELTTLEIDVDGIIYNTRNCKCN